MDKFGNSRDANPKKLLNKPNKRLNLKKKHLNRPLKCHDGLSESVSDTSEATAPLYDLIIGKQTLHDIGAVLDFKEKTITIDNI